MPDATEWLVMFTDTIDGVQYEHIAERDHAIEYLRQLIGQGKTAFLYQRIDFTVKVGVTVKAPRKRRKNSPPALEPASDTPTGPGNGAAGELKDPGAFGGQGRPVEDNPRPHGLMLPSVGGGYDQQGSGSDAGNVAKPQDRSGERTASAPLPSVFPWTCEANFDGDPKCPGPMRLDPVTKGYFCVVHASIPESHRWEFHALHASRNRPVRVAHAG